MALIDYCILWDKVESVGNSEIGANSTVLGGAQVFEACKFNNGNFEDPAQANQLCYAGLSIPGGIFLLEFWLKFKFNCPDGGQHVIFDSLDATLGIFVYITPAGIMQLAIDEPGGQQCYYNFTIPAYSTGDLVHFAITADPSAGLNEKFHLWENGNACALSSTSADIGWAMTTMELRTGHYVGAVSGNVVIDNIKVYNNITIIADVLTNRNNEGLVIPPDPVTGLSATDGTYTNHIRITWNTSALATEYRIWKQTAGAWAYLTTVTGLSYDDYAITVDEVYTYFVRAYNSGGEAEDSNEDTGYATIPVYAFEPEKPKVKILFGGMDILALGYVEKLLKVSYQKTFQRDKLIVNEISIDVKNYDNFFSINSNNSIFKDIKWLYEPFIIYDIDGNFIWDGIITNIVRDHKTKKAKIYSTDKLYQFANRIIEYTSADWETPADAFKNICDSISFEDYDTASVTQSSVRYTSKNCYVKCYINKNDNMTFQQAIEKLADIGCADAYTYANKIYFRHYWEYIGSTKVELTTSDLLTNPVIDYLDREIINDYRIGYNGDSGTPATDTAQGNIGVASRGRYGTLSLPEISAREGSQIVLKDVTSARYIGECYIKRTQYDYLHPQPLMKIEFDLKWINRYWIDLNTFFKLTYEPESFDEKVFEVFGLDIDYDNNRLHVLAYEVET